MTAHVSMLLKSRASLICFRACFLPGRAKDLSAARQERTCLQYLRFHTCTYDKHCHIQHLFIPIALPVEMTAECPTKLHLQHPYDFIGPVLHSITDTALGRFRSNSWPPGQNSSANPSKRVKLVRTQQSSRRQGALFRHYNNGGGLQFCWQRQRLFPVVIQSWVRIPTLQHYYHYKSS